MARPRKTGTHHLPRYMQQKHGAYYSVIKGKWTKLSTSLPDATKMLFRMLGGVDGSAPATTSTTVTNDPNALGMAALLSRAYPHVCVGVKKSTIAGWNSKLDYLMNALRNINVAQFSATEVHDIRNAMQGQPSRFNSMLTVLRLCLIWASTQNNLPKVASIHTVKLLPCPKRTRYLRDDEYTAIYAHACELVQVLLELCYRTAQRVSDVLHLTHQQLTPDGILFEQEKGKDVYGNGGTKLIVGWSPELRSAVDRAKALSSNVQPLGKPHYVLASRGGARIHYETFHHFFHKAVKAAGVTNARIHDLRAKAATDIARDFGIEAARQLLGHSTQEMTLRYIRDRCAVVVAGPTARAVGPTGAVPTGVHATNVAPAGRGGVVNHRGNKVRKLPRGVVAA